MYITALFVHLDSIQLININTEKRLDVIESKI